MVLRNRLRTVMMNLLLRVSRTRLIILLKVNFSIVSVTFFTRLYCD